LYLLTENFSLRVGQRGAISTPAANLRQDVMSVTWHELSIIGRHYRPVEIARKVWQQADSDDCLNLAAQMSYFFVLSLFPFFILLAALIASLPFSSFWTAVSDDIVRRFPIESQQLVLNTIADFMRSREALLSFGFLGSIWAGSSGMVSLMETLSRAYEERDTRGFWHKRILAIAVLLAIFVFLLVVFAIAVGARKIDADAFAAMHWEPLVHVSAVLIRWAAGLAFVVLTIGFLDNVLPCKRHHWRWITPGAIFATIMIVLGTAGVDLYVKVARYSQTYGSIGAFFVLMLWIYVDSLALLLGAEINSVMEKLKIMESQK
jgi:membrane protein